MNKWKLHNSLYGQLLFYLFLSAIIALIFYAAVFQMLENQVRDYAASPARAKAYSTRHIHDLQTYITREKLQRSDVAALALWNDEKWYTSIKITDSDNSDIIYYDSFLRYQSGAPINPTAGSPGNAKDGGSVVRISWDGLPYPCFTYPLRFSDGDTTVTISGPYSDQFSQLHALVSSAVFLIVFLICFFLFCRRRFSYIQVLQQEIQTICCGDLTHKLPVTGNDELTILAAHVNHMSVSLQEQLLIEEDIRQKNSDVVAAISHDLRTPLTSVICYLDLLQDGRYPDDKTMQLYIDNARTRAYQIKGMSDELFARSVQKVREDTPQWELLYGNELIAQVFSEMLYTLKEGGLKADFDYSFRQHFTMKTDVVGFRRIFDNLTSNILKHADPAVPISLSASLLEKTLYVVQKNAKSLCPVAESTGLGLGATRKLVLQHGGNFQVKDSTTFFEIRLTFPVEIS